MKASAHHHAGAFFFAFITFIMEISLPDMIHSDMSVL